MGATAKTLLLMGVLTGLLAGLGYLFFGGWLGVILFVIIAGAFNIFAYWKSDSLALRMAGAREVSPQEEPRLHRIVEEVTSLTSLPKPRVYIVDNPSPNAFATGRNPKHAVVAATTGIMSLLDDRELKGVMAHELGHVGNRDILIGAVVAVFAGAIAMAANVLQFRMIFGGFGGNRDNGNGLLALVAIILMPIAAVIIQMAVSRTREYEADRTGARVTHDPDALADALMKLERGANLRPMQVNPAAAHMFIVNPLAGFRGANFSNLFSTHPPIEERVKRLR
ncbi:MAG TPA: zinc metalloprotease HtpX, partial [Dehalococcoidia bacterium]|nr:zinc metalloprotease HtpX [Dehalococcoidia bacterium]